MMNDVIYAIGKSSSIAIVTHVNPDGDAIGSSIALMRAIDGVGKKTVDLYCQDEPPKVFDFLEGFDRVKKPEGIKKVYDLVIALDCSDLERMGSCSSIMEKADYTINIDHHVSNTHYADINIVDSDAAATGEVIFNLIDLLTSSNIGSIAEPLYTAIISDTGGFSFSNTTPKTHRITADLIEWGVDLDRISRLLFKEYSLEWVRLLGKAINSLKIYHDGNVAIMHITQEMFKSSGATVEHTTGIIQYAKDISGVELAIVLREESPHTTKVSLRSQSQIDVSALAMQFGGGGHKRAAGCTFNLPLIQAQGHLMKALNMYFEE